MLRALGVQKLVGKIRDGLGAAEIGFVLVAPIAYAQTELGIFGNFEKPYMQVTLDRALPLQCLCADHYGLKQSNQQLSCTNIVTLYYLGTASE